MNNEQVFKEVAEIIQDYDSRIIFIEPTQTTVRINFLFPQSVREDLGGELNQYVGNLQKSGLIGNYTVGLPPMGLQGVNTGFVMLLMNPELQFTSPISLQ